MKKLLINPLFLFGILLRLILMTVCSPNPPTNWYVPFLDSTTHFPTINPWNDWIQLGGSIDAFPYGYIMWAIFLPAILLCKTLSIPSIIGYNLTLLITDIAELQILRKLFSSRDNAILSIYWLSPIILVATYALGFNDIIPVFLLTLSLYYTQRRGFFQAGIYAALAISSKLSMVLVLPFQLIYFTRNKPLRQVFPHYLCGFALSSLLFLVPFAFTTSGLQMVFHNPEVKKILQAQLIVGNISIYVIPMIYLSIVYLAWAVRRLNFDLFNVLLGFSFLPVVLLTPVSPGWFIWIMPLLTFYQLKGGNKAVILCTIFSITYLTDIIFSNSFISIFSFLPSTIYLNLQNANTLSFIHTMMLIIGLILAYRIWREMIGRNDYFRLSRKPFVIGIAGDSGSGKDTLSDLITGLFGTHSIAKLSGDDYHLWDRQKPMWRVMTHLNPMANDLERFATDLIKLVDGYPAQVRHYNHETGRMSRPLKISSNDFIVASGLHALYLPLIRQLYNLRIYLDMDESLRCHFKLKRDVLKRGHSIDRVLASIEKRKPDFDRFIQPQIEHADLIFSVLPAQDISNNPMDVDNLKLKLIATSRNCLNELSLMRILIGVCGLHVNLNVMENSSETQLIIEGETCAEDIALAAKMLCPRIMEFLDIIPKWSDGIEGLMQLITLSHINQALSRRFI